MSHAVPFEGDCPVLDYPDANEGESSSSVERRAMPRFTLLIRTAKVMGATGEFLCIVRNVSPLGVRIKTFAPLPPEAEIDLELANGERHHIIKVWEDGDLVGFRFSAPVDIERLVSEAPSQLRKRDVRLNCLMPALLTAHAGECDAKFHDISQHGARIECGLHLAVGERVHIESDVLPPIDATVRWRRAPFYGVIFEQVFRFDELARLCGVAASTRSAKPDRHRAPMAGTFCC